jgi:hypothetical protein
MGCDARHRIELPQMQRGSSKSTATVLRFLTKAYAK